MKRSLPLFLLGVVLMVVGVLQLEKPFLGVILLILGLAAIISSLLLYFRRIGARPARFLNISSKHVPQPIEYSLP